MNSILIIIVYTWSLLAPLPWGIATNPQTKECGKISGGDEFGGYVLPDPWVVTYAPMVQTDTGMVRWEGSIEGYCQKIGYTYVPGNIGELYGKNQKSFIYYLYLLWWLCPLILLIIVLIIGYRISANIAKKREKPMDT